MTVKGRDLFQRLREVIKMSVKKMKELYYTFQCSETTWGMLREMYYHGLINNHNWNKFFCECKGWIWDGDKVVYYDIEKGLYIPVIL